MTAIEIIKWIGGFVFMFSIGYVLYEIKTYKARIRKLEEEVSNQRVINQSFDDYRKFKDLKDKEFTSSLKEILSKIEDLKESFDQKFTDLTEEIHSIQLENAKK